MKRHWLVTCFAVSVLVTPQSHAQVFPGTVWDTRSASEAGLRDSTLDQLVAYVGGSGCIVRYGYMVRCWGNVTTKYDWASACKPVTSTLLLFAVHRGILTGVDDRIDNWGWALTVKDRPMTFRHLANMVSGYARGEAPGSAYAYNDYAINLYSATLTRVYGTSLNQAALTMLAELQFEHGSIYGTRSGYGVNASIRDFARIGLFWLNEGRWRDTQLLPQSYFRDYVAIGVPTTTPRSTSSGSDYLSVGSLGGDSNQTDVGPGLYGFNFWFNGTNSRGERFWPDAPHDTYQANGHWGGEVVIVIPSLSIVVASVGNWGSEADFRPGSSSRMNAALKLIRDAVIDNTPVAPPNPPTNLRVE